jgi:hypothetical protein
VIVLSGSRFVMLARWRMGMLPANVRVVSDDRPS